MCSSDAWCGVYLQTSVPSVGCMFVDCFMPGVYHMLVVRLFFCLSQCCLFYMCYFHKCGGFHLQRHWLFYSPPLMTRPVDTNNVTANVILWLVWLGGICRQSSSGRVPQAACVHFTIIFIFCFSVHDENSSIFLLFSSEGRLLGQINVVWRQGGPGSADFV